MPLLLDTVAKLKDQMRLEALRAKKAAEEAKYDEEKRLTAEAAEKAAEEARLEEERRIEAEAAAKAAAEAAAKKARLEVEEKKRLEEEMEMKRQEELERQRLAAEKEAEEQRQREAAEKAAAEEARKRAEKERREKERIEEQKRLEAEAAAAAAVVKAAEEARLVEERRAAAESAAKAAVEQARLEEQRVAAEIARRESEQKKKLEEEAAAAMAAAAALEEQRMQEAASLAPKDDGTAAGFVPNELTEDNVGLDIDSPAVHPSRGETDEEEEEGPLVMSFGPKKRKSSTLLDKSLDKDLEKIISRFIGPSFDNELSWEEQGLTSIVSVAMRHEIEKSFPITLPPDCLHRCPTPRSLKNYISEETGTPLQKEKCNAALIQTTQLSWCFTGTLQSILMVFMFLLFAAPLFPCWLVFEYLQTHAILYMLLVPLYMTSYSVVVVLMKWLVIGRYKKCRITTPSFYFLRW